jgi:organic radical activating enzyme
MAKLATELFADQSHEVPILIGEGTTRRDSANDFIAERFRLADINHLGRFVAEHRADPAELLPLFAAIGSKSVGVFESLAALHAAIHGGGTGPSKKCIRVVRDLMLLNVDRRLQTIYRQFFSNAQLGPGANHEQKIAALQETRHDVLAVLNAYDWQWMADWLDKGRAVGTAENCVRRLANFAFSLNSVTFLFTRHCNISCRHCYNESGPHEKAVRIPLDQMVAIVAQMPAAGIGRLKITGGEPFLYPQDVLAMVKAARTAGTGEIIINTNGFWASSDERANQMLDRLAQAGFMQGTGDNDHIKVSAGMYHEEFIAFDRVLTLARNYYDRFDKCVLIDFELAPQGGSIDEIRKRISAAGLAERITLQFRGVGAVGRATDLAEIDRWPTHLTCSDIREIMITPDESVMPCAGLNYENNGIIIGRSDRNSLKDLVKRMQNDPILQFMATKKWDDVFTLVAKQKRDSGYSSKCDLCLHALGDLHDKTQLQATLFPEQNFYPFWFSLAKREQPIHHPAK